MARMAVAAGLVVALGLGCAADRREAAAPVAAAPRIVNVYNFIRNSDYRLSNSEDVLYGATWRQVQMLRGAGVRATWAVQYDALVNPRYQKLLKEEISRGDEIGAWWELPRVLVERAGIRWRGEHDWDSRANVGFSPGYSVEERKRLVDVYMGEFRRVFGYYPRSAGSWYIDEVTLAYMAEKYGVIASCNCKDQVGTDGYTLWGGYWNQAYYPSKLNAYMPAQNREGQIDVPVFRMLGSDPIYQYGAADRITSLEPVYPWAGGSEKWVRWFLDKVSAGPCLAFAYAQAGQENSFGWDEMRKGYTYQVAELARRAKAGEIRLQTLAESGAWFRERYGVTPATAFVAGDDWKNEGRKTAWYDSRFYRANLLWEGETFYIRDIHLFDEKAASPTHDSVLKEHALAYGTLPVMDGSLWSAGKARAGARPALIGEDGKSVPVVCEGAPTFSEDRETLLISQRLRGGGTIRVRCGETGMICSAEDGEGRPLRWGWEFWGGEKMKEVVREVRASEVDYRSDGVDYQVHVREGRAERSEGGEIRVSADQAGRVWLGLGGRWDPRPSTRAVQAHGPR